MTDCAAGHRFRSVPARRVQELPGADADLGAALPGEVQHNRRTPADSAEHRQAGHRRPGLHRKDLIPRGFESSLASRRAAFPLRCCAHVWPTLPRTQELRGFSQPARAGRVWGKQRGRFESPHNEKNRPVRSGNPRADAHALCLQRSSR